MIGRDSQGRPPFNTVLANEVEADSPGYHTALCSTEVATVFHVAESTSVKIHEAETVVEFPQRLLQPRIFILMSNFSKANTM